MKALLLDLLEKETDPFQKRNIAREYLQARILLSLHDHYAFSNWAFLGGTSLRFLYQLPRYSEDLDFSLTQAGDDARFLAILRSVKGDLEAEAYQVTVKAREQKTVAAAFIKFPGLLYEAKISPHADEVFAVKLEIDTNPPEGAHCETTVIRRFAMMSLRHYDKASLFAGKLHAVLSRPYAKGRDLYDLSWYLADRTWPAPNMALLRNALRQTCWTGPELTDANWRGIVATHLQDIDWVRSRQDVLPFLARRQDLAFVEREILMGLLLG